MPKAGMLSTDPREGAVRLWQNATATHHLVLSLGMAPAPYTAMANAFQALLGREAEAQYADAAALLKRPRTLVTAVALALLLSHGDPTPRDFIVLVA